MDDIFGFSAYSPAQIAVKVDEVGVRKAKIAFIPLVMLGVLAGAFIGLGGMLYVLVKSDPTLSFASAQLLGGLAFCLGLILVVVAGAELFTGNNLIVMAWADKKISLYDLLRNWLVVCIANFIGAIGMAVLVFLSGHLLMNDGAIAEQYINIAAAKTGLSTTEAIFRGVLCNILVCMAVWMTLAGKTVTDKIIAIIFPITGFVAAGFEHSVANMYFYPVTLLIQYFAVVEIGSNVISIYDFMKNVLLVICGNLMGGGVFVGLVYHLIYQRNKEVN
ncbi:formate/nitrite transporter family protein [Brumicola nitratireducens]|uniref:Formate/nitrite transporter n=1 Tax=Glaciecola nitratireducens (strain JCM 12485 / KCTC 12276 / FR1064) TaxID=1085623 RepID=G4QMK9_GLANF|nr:formate/nitrite transporter family protein [Glaciecola nitratireducens]AEP30961.1 formate/nitrite transporter [Glaciecola nitratireducens FR1064]